MTELLTALNLETYGLPGVIVAVTLWLYAQERKDHRETQAARIAEMKEVLKAAAALDAALRMLEKH